MTMQVQSTSSAAPPPAAVAGSPPRSDAISLAVRSAQAQEAVSETRNEAPLAAVRETRKADLQDLQDAVKKVEKFTAPLASDLQFKIDEETGVRVIKVMDRTTHEVIRQIPSEEMLAIASTLEQLQGLLVRQKA